MFADCYAGLHLFAACGAIGEKGGHVGPFAFDAERDRGAAMQIRNFAERVAACPHRVAFGDELMIVGVAPRCGGGEFFGGRTLVGADENSVLAQVLEQIFGYVARRNREWKAAIIAEIERVAA